MHLPATAGTAALIAASLFHLTAPGITQQSNPQADPASATEAVSTEVQLVKFRGNYADLAEAGGDLTTLLMGGGSPPKPFFEMLEKLELLAASESEHVLFDLTEAFAINQAQMPSVANAIQRIRDGGKKCYAYVENATTAQYQIAALCDEIMMADLGTIDLPSMSMSVMFMKDALDLLGVEMDVVRCGDFKGAVEPYLRSSMSSHLQSHYADMLKELNDDLVQRIARGRNISSAKVREAQAARLFTARDAKAAGLVDTLVPWRGAKHALSLAMADTPIELADALKGSGKRKNVNFMTMMSKMLNPREEETEFEDDSVVVLHLSGTIVDGSKASPGSIVSMPTVKTIRELNEDEEVKGVVVRINSPGGSATASEAILLALRDLAENKPVVISMGRLAASGGYYVTCLGRPILAEAGTITGSIGVFGMKPTVGALMRRLGVHEEMIALDDSAKMTSLSEPWSDEQKGRVQNMVNHIYDVFVGHVSRSRGMTTPEVLAIAGGRVWSGQQAVENGLVDRIGTVQDAIQMVAEECEIEDYEVSHLPKPRNFLDSILGDLMQASALLPIDDAKRAVLRRLGVEQALQVIVDGLTNEQPTQTWALMPETLRLR